MSRWVDFLHHVSSHRVCDGNRATHLPGDDFTIRSLWEAIDNADEQIWMTMYLLKADEVGRGTLHRLKRAAHRGVEVRVIFDHFASIYLDDKDLRPLRRAGGQVVFFHRIWPPSRKKGQLTIRNHRKLAVIDGRHGFCGGLNLSEAYGGDDFGHWMFDDTMLRVEGPCVRDMAEAFRHTWREVTGTDCEPLPRPAPFPDGVPAAVLEMDPRRPSTHLRHVLGRAIAQAEDKCYIATPYFIPAPWLHNALLHAAEQGADVRIVTAGKTDVALARAAGQYRYGTYLRAGIRIYEMNARVLHSKTVTIDGAFGVIGSFNLDLWTSRHVLDLSIALADEKLAASMEDEFQVHIGNADEVNLDEWRQRSTIKRLAEFSAYYGMRYI